MADYTDSGVLFRNDRKTPGDNRPDYQGKINVGGVEKRLAAWIKEGQKGKYMSLKVSDFEQRQERTQGPGERAAAAQAPLDDGHPQRTPPSDLDDDIPF